MSILPEVFTPKEIADHFGFSERELRKKAREIGQCHVMGNRMILTRQNVDALIEAIKLKPKP